MRRIDPTVARPPIVRAYVVRDLQDCASGSCSRPLSRFEFKALIASQTFASIIGMRRRQTNEMQKLIKGLNHVGVAVSNLDEALKTYRSTLGLEPSYVKEVEDQKIRVASFKFGGSSIELFEPTDPTSTVAAFLAKRGEGMHHVALTVDDIHATLNAAQRAGATLIDKEPRVGAERQLIAFLHPKSTIGTLVELRQD